MLETTTYSATQQVPWTKILLPWNIISNLCRHGHLLRQLITRDIQARYRGSYLGIFWSFIRPLSMLAVYAVVFGFIFQSKLGDRPSESRLDFTLALFCGLILFDFLSECVSRSPTAILVNPNFVTKVVFPLEILPVSIVGAGLVQMALSFVPLLIVLPFIQGAIPVTVFWLPVLLLPLLLLTLGIGWFLASLGVFLRDINSTIPVIMQVLMFASALFYSLHRVPPAIRRYLLLNPIAGLIDQTRGVVLWGRAPSWSYYTVLLGVSLVVAIVGYAFFMRTKRAFADVM